MAGAARSSPSVPRTPCVEPREAWTQVGSETVGFGVSSALNPLLPTEAFQRGAERAGPSQQHGRGDHQRHEDRPELRQRGGGGRGVRTEAAAGVQAEQEGGGCLHLLRLGQRGTWPWPGAGPTPGGPDSMIRGPCAGVSGRSHTPALCPSFLPSTAGAPLGLGEGWMGTLGGLPWVLQTPPGTAAGGRQGAWAQPCLYGTRWGEETQIPAPPCSAAWLTVRL